MTNPPEVIREFIPVLPGNPYPLGRHVVHDQHSRAYRMGTTPVPLVSKLWTVRIGLLDQNPLSSCTGNTGTYRAGTDDETKVGMLAAPTTPVATHTEPLDENYAIGLYSAATQIDEWNGTAYPPDDTGSSGLAIAKVLKNRGIIDSYTHGFSLDDVLQGLQHGPVMLGTNWYTSMFHPDTRGLVAISGAVAGGHEYLAIGIDVEQREIICINSWGPGWGVNGIFRMSWDTLTRLLAESGDSMMLHMVVKTAPVPTPVPIPAPTPTPVPPTPVPPAPVVSTTFQLSPVAVAALHQGAVKRHMTDNAYLEKLVRGILHVK